MSLIPPRWLHVLAQASRRKTVREFEAAARSPSDAQRERLLTLLRENQDTEFGRRHGFARIRSFEEYARAVPTQRPEEVQPWVNRLMSGERNLLSAEPPVYYV